MAISPGHSESACCSPVFLAVPLVASFAFAFEDVCTNAAKHWMCMVLFALANRHWRFWRFEPATCRLVAQHVYGCTTTVITPRALDINCPLSVCVGGDKCLPSRFCLTEVVIVVFRRWDRRHSTSRDQGNRFLQ